MNTEHLLAAASFSPQRLTLPSSRVGHLPFVVWAMQEIAPAIYVELGAAAGSTYFAICQSVVEAGLATRCYAVDTWQGDAPTGECDSEVFSLVDACNRSHFSDFSRLLRMPFDQALTSFADGSIELLHIDGLRPHEAVRRDFEAWLPKLASGAVVMFHGTNTYERDASVWRLWEDLCRRYPKNLAFPHAGGLGVLQIGAASDHDGLEWLQPHFPLAKAIAAYFLALGMHQLECDSLEKKCADLNGEQAALRIALDQRDARIASLQEDIAGRDGQVAVILASSSWRITAPLRKARRLMERMAARHSLIANLCRLIWLQIRLYGLRGVLCRLPHYLRHRQRAITLAAAYVHPHDGGPRRDPSLPPSDFRLHPDLTPGDKRIDESVSFVIPTLNAGPELPLLLRKLTTQRGLRSIEVVIVDSGSTDETVRIARDAGCTVVEIAPADFSHSHARNVGAEAASGSYLLFMVQDAFPVGSHWAYGMLAYLLEHADRRLAAVSCSEYSRSDSDMMYDSLINTHYRFLGCLDSDRLGEFRGDDHMALRANGQLSDVACLIARDLFQRYRYQGDYAEDLDLGVRLIKDGYRVAMMSSVKVIHSHNRSAYYYLKRSFVDLVFLTGLFADYDCPRILSPRGIIAGIVSVAAHLSQWRLAFDASDSTESLSREVETSVARWRKEFRKPRLDRQSCRLDDGRLDACIDSLAERYLPASCAIPMGAFRSEMDDFLETFVSRLDHFNTFAGKIYDRQDSVLRQQLRDMVLKTFAATAGTALGFMYIGSANFDPEDRRMAQTLSSELKAGI